jgi:hypothetical protein
MHPILQKLQRGDRRSIGRSNEVVAEVLARPALFRRVLEGLENKAPVLRMRAADAIEKITSRRPELLGAHKRKLLEIAGRTNQQEVRWHVALMIPRLPLSSRDRAVAADILRDYLRDKSSIVKTFAMQGLADLAIQEAALRATIVPLLEELMTIGTPAIRARGRRLLRRLNQERAKA